MQCPKCGAEAAPDTQFCPKCGAPLAAGAAAGPGSTMNIEPNVAGLLCYLAGWLTGLIFYMVEKENKFVRFHAMQSIVVFGSYSVLSIILWFIPFVGWILGMLLSITAIVLWILLMVKAYKGEKWKLPVAGGIAEKHS